MLLPLLLAIEVYQQQRLLPCILILKSQFAIAFSFLPLLGQSQSCPKVLYGCNALISHLSALLWPGYLGPFLASQAGIHDAGPPLEASAGMFCWRLTDATPDGLGEGCIMAAVSVEGVLIADSACLEQVVRHIALAYTRQADRLACNYP